MIEERHQKLFDQLLKALQKSKSDPIFFIETFCKLKDQRIGEPIPFQLWDCQKEQIVTWNTYDESITLKTRQCGISWLSGAFGLWACFFHDYFEAMVISKKEEDAVEYLSRVKFMYDNLPDVVQAVNPLINFNRLKLQFHNQSRFIAESSNPQAGRSRTLNLLIFDEAAFMPEARSIDTAATPTLEKTGGRKIIISTANGYDEYFQPKWEASVNGHTDTKSLFIPWSGDPTRSQDWWDRGYDQAKAEEQGPKWLQEHPRNHIEAFIVTGRTVFDPELVIEITKEVQKRNLRPKKYTFSERHELISELHGKLAIFEHVKPNYKYVLGCDVAEGLSRGDFSTIVVYCRHMVDGSYPQVAEYQIKLDTDTFAKDLFYLGKYYNFGMINLEMNSYGESVMNTLQKQMHYPRFYHQMRYDETSKRKVKKIGWKTTMTSKPILIDTFKSMVRDRSMRINSLPTLSEMKTFVRHDAGVSSKMGASYGAHDDLVIAQALCSIVLLEKPVIQVKKHAPKYQWDSQRVHNPFLKRRKYDKNKIFR